MAKCKGCGQYIRWGDLFGKKHPFDADGQSHFDTCPQAHVFRGGKGLGAATRGDIDTYYRERWRSKYLSDASGFDPQRLSLLSLRVSEPRGLAEALHEVGGPMSHANWSVKEIVSHIYYGGADDTGSLVAVSVNKAIGYRLRDYLGESQVRVYRVAGIYVVSGDFL